MMEENNKVDVSLDKPDKTNGSDSNSERPRRVREPRESRDREPKEIIETRISGTVKWYNVRDGYGFICRDSNNVDYFIHFSGIGIANPEHWQRSLEDGEKVLFDISKGNEKGKEAVNVTGPDGGQVQGSRFALDRARKPPKYILRGWQVPPKFLRRGRHATGGESEGAEDGNKGRRRRSETYEEANGDQKMPKKRSQKQRRRRQTKTDEDGKAQSEGELNREDKARKPRRPRVQKSGDDQQQPNDKTVNVRAHTRRRPRAMKHDDDTKREDGATTGDEQTKPTADGKKPARRPRKDSQSNKEGTDDDDLGDNKHSANPRGRRYLQKAKDETDDEEKKGVEGEGKSVKKEEDKPEVKKEEDTSVKKEEEICFRQQLVEATLGKMHAAGDGPSVDENRNISEV